ncbi:hypothetical protein AAFF_G00164990 [Aldrovandia affinis]|uniref:Uncharacterized protein n=1 Tax=Aldrovandia affinis TaxID=143900 RepID=A0AAD7RMX7_9TELE|nr:hypothetical protein AAFF_G00164990 [Aldrovandia affinis]
MDIVGSIRVQSHLRKPVCMPEQRLTPATPLTPSPPHNESPPRSAVRRETGKVTAHPGIASGFSITATISLLWAVPSFSWRLGFLKGTKENKTWRMAQWTGTDLHSVPVRLSVSGPE